MTEKCTYLPDPRHKCSIPDDAIRTKEQKLLECQKCFVWEIVFEQHQEDVL